jgi:hypothetical protein
VVWIHQGQDRYSDIIAGVFIIKPSRCTNFQNLLQHETLHVSGSSSAHHHEFNCTLGTGICHRGLKTVFEQDQDGKQWINSWWWAEELPETCRVSCRSKFGKLVHLIDFIIKKFVAMHGHTNVKKIVLLSCGDGNETHVFLIVSVISEQLINY